MTTAMLIGCGGDSSHSSNGSYAKLGLPNTLHEGFESIAMLELKHADKATLVSERTPQEIPEVEGQASSRASTDLLSNFNFYPEEIIFSRAISSEGILVSRDHCLQKCLNNPSCGSVVYISAIGGCQLHGPNQTTDKMMKVGVITSLGTSVADSYVIASRQADPAYNVNNQVYINSAGIEQPFFMKILYTDHTASDWIRLPSDSYGGIVVGGVPAPLKTYEAVVLTTQEEGDDKFSTITVNLDPDYGYHPIVHNEPDPSFVLNSSCDSKASDDSCADRLTLPAVLGGDMQGATLAQIDSYNANFIY